MYRRTTIRTLRSPVWFMINRSDAPAIRGTGSVSGPEGVSGVMCWIESGTYHEVFHHAGDINAGQPSRLYLAVTID
jgi:hypothetical protein